MATWHLKVIGLLALACGVGFVSQTSGKTRIPTFADFRTGETIEVDFRSSGCFNSEHLIFVFRRGTDLQVEVSKVVFDKETNDDKVVSQGRVALSKSETEGLDGLIKFYRNLEEGYCTTAEFVQVTYRKGEEEIAKENFVDRTCSYNVKDLTRFTELRDKLGK